MASSIIFAATILLASVPLLCAADNPPSAPNSDPTYQQLRNLMLSGEAMSVANFELKRDAGTFHLHSGTVCFVAPVQGKVTGAVFSGEGHFVLDPPLQSERNSLMLLTKENEFSESFTQAVFRFTDSTYDEFKKANRPASAGCDANLLKDSQNTTRHKLKNNLEARILEDVLSPEPGGLFVAFIHGKRYSDKEIYEIEPNHGSDQVSFRTYDENKWGNWALFNFTVEHAPGSVGHLMRIEHQQLDVTFEKNGSLSGKAVTDFVARRNGVRVVPLDLFRPLRVQSVTANGQPLAFIQEDKNEDGNFAVILPKVLSAREKLTITTSYGGKDAVINEGGGNYYPNGAARENWYPNNPGAAFGEYALYDMTLRIPKGMKMAATGALVSESNDSGQNVTVWKSEAPQTVAGFSFGRFKEEEVKLIKPEYKVVTAHEVAHQWWGHTVGFASGRDQWMSEGFAELSASLYVSMIEKNPKKFIEFWNDERELLLERDAEGFRAIDAGPVTMGYRASNSRTGFSTTRRLIYPKGAYILHMIRMMMWDRKTGDQNFKAAMQDFVQTYSGKSATTEDFKAMMEKHMTAEMDLEGNHRLDWFFNEYVYGTALPTYKIAYTFEKDANGDVVFGFKVTQSGVDDKFRMIVPVYLELIDGRTVNLGRARLVGNTSVEQKVPMKGLKDVPKRALVNYNDDVLASN
jgi:hypothetical protein